jgi:Fe-S-cluster containining protein
MPFIPALKCWAFWHSYVRKKELGETGLKGAKAYFQKPYQQYQTKDGKEIPKPSLVETREGELMLYVDKYCPAFEEGIGCKVHDDPRRPQICSSYPLKVKGDIAVIRDTCSQFNRYEMRESFRDNFPEIRLCKNDKEFLDASKRYTPLD